MSSLAGVRHEVWIERYAVAAGITVAVAGAAFLAAGPMLVLALAGAGLSGGLWLHHPHMIRYAEDRLQARQKMLMERKYDKRFPTSARGGVDVALAKPSSGTQREGPGLAPGGPTGHAPRPPLRDGIDQRR